MRLATRLVFSGEGTGGASAWGKGSGSSARSAVWPIRVWPTAKAGPPPPSEVDSRLRPTTRGGGPLGASAGGGGALATLGGGFTGFSICSGLGGSGGGGGGGGG